MNFDDENFDLDDFLNDDDFNEMIRLENERVENHPLMVQAHEIENVLTALLEADAEIKKSHGSVLHEASLNMLIKLDSALRSDSYLQSMQNAAIIRDHASFLYVSNHFFEDSQADKVYVKMYRDEMEKFKALFNDWAKEIHQMEKTEDDWGLFI